MLRKQNLLTAGLMVLLSVAGRTVAVAGHPGSGGGSGFHVSSGPHPSYSMQMPVNHNSSNLMSQANVLKSQQFQTNNVLQTNKLNQIHVSNSAHFPTNTNLNQLKIGNLNNKIGQLPVNQLHTPTSTALKGINLGNVNLKNSNPVFTKPVLPVNTIKPIINPPMGGFGKCGTGYGNCWGNGCGFGWGFGCGNWGCGNWGYGCGYWPGYFGCYNGCYNYPLVQPYPVVFTTPGYVSTTPAVVPTSTTLVLNDTAVPPAPAPAKTRDIDLGIKSVQLVEAANADHGALYRVTIANMGPSDLDVATRVAALGIKDSQPNADTPRAIETINSLKVGETTNLDLRMPVAANALPKLLVAVEIPDNFKDTNESNNVAAGEVSQLTQVASAN